MPSMSLQVTRVTLLDRHLRLTQRVFCVDVTLVTSLADSEWNDFYFIDHVDIIMHSSTFLTPQTRTEHFAATSE
jgi:hypothetical protein